MGSVTTGGTTPLEFLHNIDVLYFVSPEETPKGLGRNARNRQTSMWPTFMSVAPCGGSGHRRGLVVKPKVLEAERKGK